MDLNEAKSILKNAGYTINETVDADDWYSSDARNELDRYMLNLVVPEVCKNCNITAEEFWKCFQDDAYMDYILPISRRTIADWANDGIKRMSEEYRLLLYFNKHRRLIMPGKENIERYIEAHKTVNELYELADWVADKLGKIYISCSGYYDFKGIELKGDRYEITVDWTVSGETNYGETFTVPADLCEKCFSKETRDEAYAELKKIKNEERRIREAEQKAAFEKARIEQEARAKELRRKQYEELKKEFEE